MSAEATEPPVPATLRRERMLAEIQEREFVHVGELSNRFGVSAVTVRGDLDSLAAKGKVHRVRGGAIPRQIRRQEQPFEVTIRARRHGLQRLADLVPEEQRDLAVALRDVARRYDALFDFQLPYMMVAQEAPHDQPDWHLAFELYPVHRAPGVTKIRASVETGLGLFLNDVAPEDAARQLARLAVPAEPIELDALFAVTQPNAAMIS